MSVSARWTESFRCYWGARKGCKHKFLLCTNDARTSEKWFSKTWDQLQIRTNSDSAGATLNTHLVVVQITVHQNFLESEGLKNILIDILLSIYSQEKVTLNEHIDTFDYETVL